MSGRTVDDLVQSIMLDSWPRMAALVDFGLDTGNTQERYEAYYYPIRAGEITKDQLEVALGDGPKLTALLRSCEKNPHKKIKITTVYDMGLGKEDTGGQMGDE